MQHLRWLLLHKWKYQKKNVCVCKKSYHLTRATSEKNISMFDLSFLHVGSQFFILKQEFYVFNFLFLQIFFLLSLFLLYYKPSQISNFFFCKHYKSDHVLIKNKKKLLWIKTLCSITQYVKLAQNCSSEN